MIKVPKPIIRWSFGNHCNSRNDCLKCSIASFYKLYKNKFRYYLLYNASDPDIHFPFLKVINQRQFKNSLRIPPTNVAWKLYPPRLDINTQEIFIDSDVIIYKKMEEINELLNNNKPFIAGDNGKSYGNYDPGDVNVNSGFFGLPRKFDFKSMIEKSLKYNRWANRFDEQGIVAQIITKLNPAIISLNSLGLAWPNSGHVGKYGSHFIKFHTNNHSHWRWFYNREKHKICQWPKP